MSIATLLLIGSPAFAGYREDVAVTCDRLATDALSSKMEVLRSQRFGRMCGFLKERIDYTDDKAKLWKDHLDQHTGYSGWKPFIETRFQRSQLDRLIFAQAQLARLELDDPLEDFLENYARYLWFQLAHQSIDLAGLRSEVTGDPALEGEVRTLLLDLYTHQQQELARLQAFRSKLTQRAPELAQVFDIAEATWQRYEADRAAHPGFTAQLDALVERLIDGERPGVDSCELPILAFQEQHAGTLGWDSTVVQVSAHVGATCARVRGDEVLEMALLSPLYDQASVLGPWSAVVVDVNAYLLQRMGSTGAPPKLAFEKLFLPPGRGVDPPFGINTRSGWGYRLGTLYPHDGPMQVASITPVTYNGVPFVRVDAKGMKQSVPEVSCVQVQDGWTVGNGKIDKKMVNSCELTGRMTEQTVGDDTLYLPKAYAGALQKGVWFRRKSITTGVEEGMMPGNDRSMLSVGLPVFVAGTLAEFTSTPGTMVPWAPDAPPRYTLP